MKATMRISLTLAAVCLMTQMAKANLVITEVQSSSDHSEDWFELTNAGATAIDLENYYWDDNGPTGNDGALFPAISIAPGESLVFVGLEFDTDLTPFVGSWGGGFAAFSEESMDGPDTFSGLSSGGDQIEIWDADPNTAATFNLVASVSFGAAPGTGQTFEWDTNGNFLGLSEIGENGAFRALHDGSGLFPSSDIGSPGTAVVPEPAGLALVALGLFGVICSRRK